MINVEQLENGTYLSESGELVIFLDGAPEDKVEPHWGVQVDAEEPAVAVWERALVTSETADFEPYASSVLRVDTGALHAETGIFPSDVNAQLRGILKYEASILSPIQEEIDRLEALANATAEEDINSRGSVTAHQLPLRFSRAGQAGSPGDGQFDKEPSKGEKR